MRVLPVADPFIIVPIVGLSGISLFTIASTAPNLFISQLLFFLIGACALVIFSSTDFRVWARSIGFIYIVCFAVLAITFLGPTVRGATRWIDVAFFRIQPSELVKPFINIVFAKFFSNPRISKFSSFVVPILLFIPIIGLIFKQPDLGNVLVFLTIFISFTLISTIPILYILMAGLTTTVLLPFIFKILKPYQRDRIISFLNPQADPIGAGYNALQSMIAIGSGQLLGLGLGRGTQSRLLFLPEYHTDFIFASLVEELGFLGGSVVILFYIILLGRILSIAFGSSDRYGKFLAIGVFSQFFIQVFINIGMNLGILPITGITLPLVSYGGSSILSSFIALGIIISIAKVNRAYPLVIR